RNLDCTYFPKSSIFLKIILKGRTWVAQRVTYVSSKTGDLKWGKPRTIIW
ncbi:unnamed protein product, partial [Gulo gulo]